MTRAELEHAIRAACDVSGDDEVYVFGSQAILGQYPDAPESLRQSAEADIAPPTAIDKADVIDANLGELSRFHEAFGFYVHGVPIDAAVPPIGWERRAIEVRNDNTRSNAGWCVETHDLAVSKLVVFRDKDRYFVTTLLVERLIDPRRLYRRLHQLPNNPKVTTELIAAIGEWIGGALKESAHARSEASDGSDWLGRQLTPTEVRSLTIVGGGRTRATCRIGHPGEIGVDRMQRNSNPCEAGGNP